MYHFYFHFLPCLWCKLVLLCGFVEDLSHHFSRLIIACFVVFCSDSVAVWGFAIFEFVDCSSQLFCRDLWDSCRHIGVAAVHVNAALIFVLTEFLFSLYFFFVVNFFVEFSEDIGNPISRRDDFPFSFFILVMSSLCFADLIPGMFFTPLKSASIRWMSCCLFILSFVSDTFLKAFPHFFQALFLFFGCVSSLLDESSDVNILL